MTTTAAVDRRRRWRNLLTGLALVALVCAAYVPALE